MRIEIEEINDIIIISLDGTFHFDTVPLLEEKWSEQLKKSPSIIAINCINLFQIDSAAIGHLVKFLNFAMEKDIQLVFYNLSSQIQQLFITAKLNRFFTITTESAFRNEYLLRS